MDAKLKSRLEEVRRKHAPSMVASESKRPPKPKSKPEVIEAPIPTMEEIITGAKDRNILRESIHLNLRWALQESEAKKQRAPLSDGAKEILGRYGLEEVKFMCGDLKVSAYYTPRSFVDPKKLLAAGVQPATIAKCTVTTRSLSLRITPPGMKEVETNE